MALFSSRFPNRMNKVMRAFLEAYAKATKETMEREDRFPNLREVQDRMEYGETYNAKKRFMDSTGFFEEVDAKPTGVFLIPRAKEFSDGSGTYTNLKFDFGNGKVTLPVLVKGEAVAGRFAERHEKTKAGWEDFRSEWEDLQKFSWREFFSLDKPILYILLLISTIMNAFLIFILAYLISRL